MSPAANRWIDAYDRSANTRLRASSGVTQQVLDKGVEIIVTGCD
jgi:hypothetical protein